MSAMTNTTPLVTTVTKPATNPRDVNATPRVNIQEFCDEYYEEILPIIMDKVHRDRQKDVHTRLDFGEGHRERTREDSHHSSVRSRTTKLERVKVQDRLRYGDLHVLDRLGHRRRSAFDRLSETYSPSTTKSRPRWTDSRDPPWGRSHPYGLDTSKEDRPKDRERFHSVGESYDDSFSHSYHDENRSRHMKRRRDNESLLSSVSRSDSSDGRYRRSRSKRHKSMDEEDLTRPWMCEEEDPFTPRIRNFKSSRRTRMPNNVKTYDGTGDPEDHVKNFQMETQVERWAMPTWCHMFNSTLIGAARVWFDELPPESINSYKDLKVAFLAYFMQQKKYVKDPVEIHNIKQKDGKTIEDFMKRFKVETGRMKGAPESAVASKKKGHASWKAHDQSKRQNSDKRSDFWGHLREGRRSNRFTPLQGYQKRFLRLKRIEELMRAGKLSHLIKEIKHGRDQSKTGKKETTTKDKPTIIYMIQSWQRTTRKKVTQSFERVKEITFPPLAASNETEGPLVIEAEMGGHMIYHIRRGIVTIRSTVLIPTKCTSMITSSVVSKEEKTRPANFKVALHLDFPDQENLDIFAWQPSDMTGVPRSVAEHRLNIREGYLPVRQKKRGQAPKRAKAIQVEVQKLVEAGIMIEVYYHDWLSNPVMVKKHDDNWRMCVNFTDLNKAYAYKGYHQIQLAEPDEEKTAFHTGQGVYCYTKMPFGLKNAGATYQRLINKAFESQIGRNIEVYVDDLVVKTYTEADMMRDIKETFRTLRKTAEAEQAFKQLKQHLSELPLLVAPKPKEELIIYLSATHGAISAVLVIERGTVQTPIYFISRALQGPILNYTPMEKLVLSLVFAAKRLRRYFQAHPITVITNQPIKQIMSRLDVVGRLQKWSIMLGEHNITDMPRTSIKEQILADFLIEMPGENPQAAPAAKTQQEPWTLFMDGSSCVDGSDTRLILTNPEGIEFTYALRFQFAASNNEVDYEALIAGLWIAAWMGVKNVHVSVNSKLVANQVLGTYVSKEDNMVKYLEIVKSLAVVPYAVVKMCWTAPGGGIVIAGPFPEGPGKVKFLIVVMDYFTKWIEAKAVATITSGQVKKFVWDNIVCHLGISGEIVSDNGKQFNDNPFKDWCDKLNITQRFASVKHLQSNGLVERANRSLGEGIKSRPGEGNKNWVEELPHVLWVHRTMIKSSHGDIPFYITYGTEAVIPTEIGMPTYRTAAVDVVSNDESRSSGWEARTKVGRTLRGNRGAGRWGIKTAVHGRNNSSKDVEYCQS
nr:reverse transcriptase domain-containing protein [Tanacetum cinerariifolium]